MGAGDGGAGRPRQAPRVLAAIRGARGSEGQEQGCRARLRPWALPTALMPLLCGVPGPPIRPVWMRHSAAPARRHPVFAGVRLLAAGGNVHRRPTPWRNPQHALGAWEPAVRERALLFDRGWHEHLPRGQAQESARLGSRLSLRRSEYVRLRGHHERQSTPLARPKLLS